MKVGENIRPRLLIILNRFVIGGQAVDTIPLAWHLHKHFDILILYGEKEKDEIEPAFLLEKYPGLQLKKVAPLRRSINPFIDLLAFYNILSILISYKPHIVHTHGAKSGFIGRLSAWLAGAPVIIHTFHGHFFHSYFNKLVSCIIAWVERCMGKITTAGIALGPEQKADLVNRYKILPVGKLHIIPLGFAFDEWNDQDALRQSFRNKYGLQNDDVAIGIVGRIVAIKNHSFFVNVVANVLNDTAGARPAFFIVGDGDQRKQVEHALEQKNISYNNKVVTTENRVVFTSWLTNMYQVMNGLDIIVLTSLNEGTPLSVIEAQFFKRPVISTNAGGVKDTMVNGLTGYVIDNNEVATFSDKVRLLLKSKQLRNQMGEEGYKFASEKFSKHKEVVQTRLLYLQLLRQKGYNFQLQKLKEKAS